MRNIVINLAALIRIEYSETVSIPDNMSEAQIQALIQKRYTEVDMGLFTSDNNDFIEQAHCDYTEATDYDADPSLQVEINDGVIETAPIDGDEFDDYEWQPVPKTWWNPYCPAQRHPSEVELRNGTIKAYNHATDFESWYQSGKDTDIIAYCIY